jgi:hypothetical protein
MLVKLDDEIVPWSIPHDWQGSVDRAWIEVPQPVQGGLSAGNHTLSFALNEEAFADASPRQRGVDEVVRQICSVEVSEYGQDDVFERQENFVGAFPTSVRILILLFICLARLITSSSAVARCTGRPAGGQRTSTA